MILRDVPIPPRPDLATTECAVSMDNGVIGILVMLLAVVVPCQEPDLFQRVIQRTALT